MKPLLTIVLLLLVGMNSAISQSVDREIFPEQVSIDHNQAVKSFSGDFVTMKSSELSETREFPEVTVQTAIVNQIGMANMVLLTQSGQLNYAIISTIGDHNHVDWSQIGIHNRVSVNLTGNHNRVDGLQDGHNNQLILEYEGDGLDQSFLQHGSDQFLEFIGVGIPMTVTQRGDGAMLIIENR
jgi:hypothetical protein